MGRGKKINSGSKKDYKKTHSTFTGNVKTSYDFKNLMSTMMVDILADRITPQRANAVCNAGGKLLKIVEMESRIGVHRSLDGEKTINLVK